MCSGGTGATARAQRDSHGVELRPAWAGAREGRGAAQTRGAATEKHGQHAPPLFTTGAPHPHPARLQQPLGRGREWIYKLFCCQRWYFPLFMRSIPLEVQSLQPCLLLLPLPPGSPPPGERRETAPGQGPCHRPFIQEQHSSAQLRCCIHTVIWQRNISHQQR